MTGSNPMSFFSDNVDAWGPIEWFDRLAKAVHARSRAVSEKDDLSFELYQNIASSSATRLVSDFEDKVRMALTTLRELEKANVAYVDANTKLLSTLENLQRENEALKEENGSLLDENIDLRNEPWPEWAKAVLKVVRSHTGYDGYDDATEGVDMPLEHTCRGSRVRGEATYARPLRSGLCHYRRRRCSGFAGFRSDDTACRDCQRHPPQPQRRH